MEEDVLANGSEVFNYKSWMKPNPTKIKSLWRWGDPEDVPLRISISGVAGTGKRKLSKSLARKLDITDITGVARTVKDLGGSLSKGASMEDEFMFILAQLWEQHQYDEYVSAGSLIDLIAHMDYIATLSGEKKHKRLCDAAANLINVVSNNAYTVLFYLPYRNKPKADGVRSVDSRFLSEIDRLIRYYLEAYDLDYLPLDGTHTENVRAAMSYLEEFNLLDERDI